MIPLFSVFVSGLKSTVLLLSINHSNLVEINCEVSILKCERL